ncbi:MAG: hypothetical protein AAGA21_09505 [Pseudomonadota bacterium]
MNSRFDLSDLRPFMLGCMLAASLAVAGCGGHSIQTTSGKAYLEKHNVASPAPIRAESKSYRAVRFDEALRQVASIEPTLTFPARIGIVKIGTDGTPTPLYPEEVEAWSEMAAGLGSDYGTFLPINPLVYDQALSEAANTGLLVRTTGLEKIRLAAARQHLDAIIAYETSSQATRKANALAFGDLTIIGAFVLPSRKIESEGYAAGIILDPISGYPYGQVEAAAVDSAHTTWVNKSEKKVDVQRNTEIGASVALAEETGKALQKLRLALAEQRSAAIEK